MWNYGVQVVILFCLIVVHGLPRCYVSYFDRCVMMPCVGAGLLQGV